MESQTHSKGGRPTSYKPEYCETITEYFKSFADEPFTKECMSKTTKYYDEAHGSGVKETHEDYKLVPKKLPTLFGFAQSIGVQHSTVWRWANERIGVAPEKGQADYRPNRYPEFCNAYKQVKHFQTEYLTAIGLGGLAPSAMVIFTAKNVIGWRDKTEMGFTDPKGNAVSGGFVVLPHRISEEDAQKEFADQEAETVVE